MSSPLSLSLGLSLCLLGSSLGPCLSGFPVSFFLAPYPSSSTRDGGYASEPVRLSLQDIMQNARFNATEEKPAHGNSVKGLLRDETASSSLSHTHGWVNLNHRNFDVDSALDVFVDIEVPLPKRTEVTVVVGHNHSVVGVTRVTNQQTLQETRFVLAEELYHTIPSSFKFLVDGKLLERHEEPSIRVLEHGSSPTLTLIPTYTIQPVLKEVYSRSFEVAWMAQVLQSYEGISLKGATVEIRSGDEVEVQSEEDSTRIPDQVQTHNSSIRYC
jgi:hypothetical protein